MSQEHCLEIAKRRSKDLGLPENIIVNVQFGDTSQVFTSDDHLGCVLRKGEEQLWMIIISDKTPDDLLEEVVTHEVLHVLFQYEAENGEESLVDLCAKLLLRLPA